MGRLGVRRCWRLLLGCTLLAGMGYVLLLIALYQPWRHPYKGEGVFVDKGWRVGLGERYNLRLASIRFEQDLGRVQRFEIGPLPAPMRLRLRFPKSQMLRGSQLVRTMSFRVRAWSPNSRGSECIRVESDVWSSRYEEGAGSIEILWLGDDVAVGFGAVCPRDAGYIWPSYGSPVEVEFTLLGWEGRSWDGEDPVLEMTGGPWE